MQNKNLFYDNDYNNLMMTIVTFLLHHGQDRKSSEQDKLHQQLQQNFSIGKDFSCPSFALQFLKVFERLSVVSSK